MKKHTLLLALLLTCTGLSLSAQTWTSDPNHSRLGFSVKHMMINNISGRFNDFDLTVTATKPDFSDATVQLSAKVASINTSVDARDKHLKSEDFFNAELYPELLFRSTKVEMDGTSKYKLHGDLTMHGVTKPVVLDVEHTGTANNPMNGRETMAFTVEGTLNRSDFGVGSTSSVIADKVKISADIEVVKK